LRFTNHLEFEGEKKMNSLR